MTTDQMPTTSNHGRAEITLYVGETEGPVYAAQATAAELEAGGKQLQALGGSLAAFAAMHSVSREPFAVAETVKRLRGQLDSILKNMDRLGYKLCRIENDLRGLDTRLEQRREKVERAAGEAVASSEEGSA